MEDLLPPRWPHKMQGDLLSGDDAQHHPVSHPKLEGRADALLGHGMNALDDRQCRLHLIDPTCKRYGVKLTIDNRDVLNDDVIRLIGEPEGDSSARPRIDPKDARNTVWISKCVHHHSPSSYCPSASLTRIVTSPLPIPATRRLTSSSSFALDSTKHGPCTTIIVKVEFMACLIVRPSSSFGSRILMASASRFGDGSRARPSSG